MRPVSRMRWTPFFSLHAYLTLWIIIFVMKTLGCFLVFTCILAAIPAYADSDFTVGAAQYQGKLTQQSATQTATTSSSFNPTTFGVFGLDLATEKLSEVSTRWLVLRILFRAIARPSSIRAISFFKRPFPRSGRTEQSESARFLHGRRIKSAGWLSAISAASSPSTKAGA